MGRYKVFPDSADVRIRWARVPAPRPQYPRLWNVIAASSVGTMIEWYDFYIFGSLATIIAPLFYPQGNDTLALGLQPIWDVLVGAQRTTPAFTTIFSFTAALKDARGFCAREPDACAIGSQALHVFGQKAQNGARMLYEFLSSNAKDEPTGSTPKPGRDTLTAEDREAPWLSPQKAAGPQTPPRRAS